MLSLPGRHLCESEESLKFSEALCSLLALILKQVDSFEPVTLKEEQQIIKKKQEAEIEIKQTHKIDAIYASAGHELKRALEIARQKEPLAG